MKLLNLMPFLFLLVSTVCPGQDNSKAISKVNPSAKIELIDFYGTHRCVTCKAIEANARFTIDTYFQDALQQGKLEFKAINVDEEKNYAIAERFEAAGTALFINVINGEKERHIDLTNFAFEKGRDKEAFSVELKEKINEQLKAL